MDLPAFRSELDRLSDAVDKLGPDAGEAEALRQSLTKSWTVRAGEERFEVSTHWFDAELASMAKEPAKLDVRKREIHSRLEALREQAAALEKTSAEPNQASARTTLNKILQRPEFKTVAQQSWWDRAQAALWRWLGRIVDWIFGRLGKVSPGREILVWVVIGIAFVLLAIVGRGILLRAARSESMRIKAARPAGKTWNEWAQDALRAAAKGDYRKAVHAAYWAGVFRLADLGAWELHRSRTPREYLRLLEQQKPPLVAPAAGAERVAALANLTRRLEITWYGFEPATEANFREAVAHLEALGCRFPSSLATARS